MPSGLRAPSDRLLGGGGGGDEVGAAGAYARVGGGGRGRLRWPSLVRARSPGISL